MWVKSKFLFIVFQFFWLDLFAQSIDNTRISGQVLSAETNAPIAWAHVYVERYMLGTATNSDGNFEFIIPDSLAFYPVIISAIGYNSVLINIDDHTSHLPIYLSEARILLDVLDIKAEYDSAEMLIEEALKNLPNNYPTKTYYLQGFLRELSLLDTTFTRLVESALSIKRSGYSKKIVPQKNEIRIDQFRKSFDYREPDRLNINKTLSYLPLAKNTSIKLINEFDLIDFLFRPIEYHYFSNSNIISSFDWQISKVIQTKQDTIVMLEFISNNKASVYRKGEIYINTSDFAILKIVSERFDNPSKIFEPIKNLYSGFLKESVTVEYYNKGDRYFLKSISAFYMSSDAPFTKREINDDGFLLGQQYMLSTYLTNAVYPKKEYEGKIKKKDTEKFDAILYDKEMEYDPVFWANYNMVMVDELVEKARRDMEKEVELEKQFKIEKEKH